MHTRKLPADEQSRAAGEPSITRAMLSPVAFDSGQRQIMIEQLAYQYAESRGFAPGHELDDWLAAEAAIDARLISASRVY
ncbi:MAG: DUF2934 domain-containing protein [Steroidobacter sp.]